MTSEERDEFARTLVAWVRDEAIQSSDATLLSSQTSTANRWRDAIDRGDVEAAIRTVIPDVVDETVARLLIAIDQGVLELSFKASSGRTVNLSVEGCGELCGWYGGSESWRTSYSRERLFDAFAGVEIAGKTAQ